MASTELEGGEAVFCEDFRIDTWPYVCEM